MDQPDIYIGLYHEDLNIAEQVWEGIDQAAFHAGYRFRRTWISHSNLLPRGLMNEQEAIPQDALLLVHGKFSTSYNNVGKAYQLQQQRTDLRFIIMVDGNHCSKDDFAQEEDYHLVKEGVAREFHPHHKIVFSLMDLVEFVNPNPPHGCSLEQYLHLWRALGT